MNRSNLSLLICCLFAAPSSATSSDLSVPNSLWSDLTLLNEQVQLVRESHPNILAKTHDNNHHDRSLQLRQLCNIAIELFDAVAPRNENRECACNLLQQSLTCHYEAVECANKVLPTLDITLDVGLTSAAVDICQEFQENEFERVCVQAELKDLKYDVCQRATMGFGDDITECSCQVCDEYTIQVDCSDRHPQAKTEGCQRIFFEDTCLDFAPIPLEDDFIIDTSNNNIINLDSLNLTGFSRYFHGQQADKDDHGGNFTTEYDNNVTGFSRSFHTQQADVDDHGNFTDIDNNVTGFSRFFHTQQADDDDGIDDDMQTVDDDIMANDDLVGFVVVEETETPRERATTWTQNDPNTNYTSSKQIQRYAMAALYYSTTVQGMEWFRNDNWLSYEVDECEWFTNSSDYPCTLTGELEILDLTDNLLYGPLSPEIGYLRTLQQLFLAYNSLSGILPTTIGSLTNLVDIDLSATDMYGTIPTQLGLLTNLESLSLQYNWFNGTIPSELGLLTNAFSIELFSNDLSGSVPAEICNLIANNGTEVYVDCGATNCTCGCMCTTQVSK